LAESAGSCLFLEGADTSFPEPSLFVASTWL
jgi:hypothetical protein